MVEIDLHFHLSVGHHILYTAFENLIFQQQSK